MDADQMYELADRLVKERKERGPDPKPPKRLLRAKAVRDSAITYAWRENVLERDQGCVRTDHANPAFCSEGFACHHVVPQQTLRREAPELLWAAELGITLCGLAHRQHHSGVRAIRWQELPAEVRAFCRANGFGDYISRKYPFVSEEDA